MQRLPTSGYFEVSPNFAGVNSSTYGLRLFRGEELVYESFNRPLLPFNDSTYSYQLWSPVAPQSVRVSVRPSQGLVYEYASDCPAAPIPRWWSWRMSPVHRCSVTGWSCSAMKRAGRSPLS